MIAKTSPSDPTKYGQNKEHLGEVRDVEAIRIAIHALLDGGTGDDKQQRDHGRDRRRELHARLHLLELEPLCQRRGQEYVERQSGGRNHPQRLIRGVGGHRRHEILGVDSRRPGGDGEHHCHQRHHRAERL